ncbi:unnamed protein product [Rotaria sordida]|uniref:Uncharacterized protein n=1 Tax=Rotaria sordida TaxID=392033 RepID=A0A820AJJ5_9BILA|nr:unnamed protein product [Rotaria sordida]
MYIIDLNNERIQKWLANATKGTTLIQNLIYLYGITMDFNENIYYTDTNDQAIYQLNIVSNQTVMIVGDENRHHHCNVSFFPTAMKLDKFENIFVIINGSS